MVRQSVRYNEQNFWYDEQNFGHDEQIFRYNEPAVYSPFSTNFRHNKFLDVTTDPPPQIGYYIKGLMYCNMYWGVLIYSLWCGSTNLSFSDLSHDLWN